MTATPVKPPHMLWFLWDAANLMTMAGLACAGTSIFFSGAGNRPAAIIFMVWACGFDWFDGRVARMTGKRSVDTGRFGAQLDSLADIVSGAVCPAALLYGASGFQLWALPGALVLLVAGATRLAYFDVFGTAADGSYVGLTIEKNIIAVALAGLAEPLLSPAAFVTLLYATVLLVAGLNVSTLRTPKITGRGAWVQAGLVVILTVVYGSRLG